MKYRILTILCAIMLPAWLVVGYVTARSWSIEDRLFLSRWQVEGQVARGSAWGLHSERGRLAVSLRTQEVATAGKLDPAYWAALANDADWSWTAVIAHPRGRPGATDTLMNRMGFHYVDASVSGSIPMRYREFSMPGWFMLAMMGIPPLAWLIVFRRRRNRMRCGKCPQCGHVLPTDGIDQCPACGHHLIHARGESGGR